MATVSDTEKIIEFLKSSGAYMLEKYTAYQTWEAGELLLVAAVLGLTGFVFLKVSKRVHREDECEVKMFTAAIAVALFMAAPFFLYRSATHFFNREAFAIHSLITDLRGK